MAKGRWIGLNEYYNELGYEVYGDEWNEDYIKQLEKHEGRDVRSEAYKKASKIRKLLYRRIWDDLDDIQVKYRLEQPYAPVNFIIEEWFIKRSQCVDAQGNVRTCRIYLPEKETRGRPEISQNKVELIFLCVNELYPDANEQTEIINVSSVEARVKEKIETLNRENGIQHKVPAYGTISKYVREKYPASRKKTRNSKK